MTRTVPYLAELQPEMFCEVHPDLARERGLEHGGWATVYPRGPRSKRACSSPSGCGRCGCTAAPCTRSGFRTTGAARARRRGDSANDLAHMALDPNVHIQEVKAFTCGIRPGRAARESRAARAASSEAGGVG